MSQMSNTISQLVEKIYTYELPQITSAVQSLIEMNSPESYAALHHTLDDLQQHPLVYWHIINGLDEAGLLNADEYYQSVFEKPASRRSKDLKDIALREVHDLGEHRATPLIYHALLHIQDDSLVRIAVSFYVELLGESAVYYLSMLMRQHPNYYVRRAVAKQMAYRFEIADLLPIAENLIYADGVDTHGRSAAITLTWHIIIQHSLGEYEQDFVRLLTYAMFCVPDLGIIPYRCLMEIDVPEAHAVLEAWDVKNAEDMLPASMRLFR